VADSAAIAAALQTLSRSDNYRILRRLPIAREFNPGLNDDLVIGIILDVETTGLDSDIDEVIELGMMKFSFARNGDIGQVIEQYRSFNEPTVSIPEEITRLTGIRQSDVKDHRISDVEIRNFVDGAALVIAHNAAFDRPFAERLFAGFSEFFWACSATEIQWRAEGISGSRLEYIASQFGYFYEGHRAIDDCSALLNILSFTLPRSQQLALGQLLNAARRIDVRIFANGAPYETRKTLKLLGYRWNDGQNGYPRAWWKDVPQANVDEELARLESAVPRQMLEPKFFRMSGKDRFRRIG
jgi:DNA polymerase-3 subunit epsilon